MDIGYKFKNEEIYTTALTHSSYANEKPAGKCHDNERLEFLGDAVLELVVSTLLFNEYPAWPEGKLTKARASIVCEPTLAKCAGELGLGEEIRLGRGEEKTGGRGRKSILSDAYEALIGAIYLDGGYEYARNFIMRTLIDKIDKAALFVDSKTDLQEIIQNGSLGELTYVLVSDEGPSHDKTFVFEARLNGEVIGTGSGHSKKEAEQHAAAQAINKLNR